MTYSIENEYLKVSVDTRGAELVSVVDKKSGEEMLWSRDPEIWGRQAPVLFPYVGRLKDGEFLLEGKSYKGKAHGFMKDLEHECLEASAKQLHFKKEADAETLALFPRKFVFETLFVLEGRSLKQKIRVSNAGEKTMRFGLGFHPGFALPFDEKHVTADYELRFDSPQTPMVSEIMLEEEGFGLSLPTYHKLADHAEAIPLRDSLFENDSLTLTDLSSKTIALVEKDSGRSITVRIEGYPNVLLWSAPTPTMQFICIEPWTVLQDAIDASGDWNEKPCAAELNPAESWETELVISFDRS